MFPSFSQAESNFSNLVSQFGEQVNSSGTPLSSFLSTTPPSTVPSPGTAPVSTPSIPTGPGTAAIAGLSGLSSLFGGKGIGLSRVVAFFLGLICIGGAIFLFKPAQQIVTGAVSRGRQAAELIGG